MHVCPVVELVNNATSSLKFYTGKKRGLRNQIWIPQSLSFALKHAWPLTHNTK